MKAVEIRAFGRPEGLAVIDLAEPSPADGQVLIAVEAIGGSIGIMTVQLAARGGASAVAVTASSAERGERLRELGATHVLDRADFGMQLFAAFQKSPSFATFSSDTVPAPERRAVRAAQFEAAGRGELEMVVHEVLPLEQAVLAHQKMAAGEVLGRIVLVPGGHALA